MRKENKQDNRIAGRRPDQIGTYFVTEWKPLLAVTVSGLIYNIGLLAGPWFEGRLAQCLLDVFSGKKFFADMLFLVCSYVAVIGFVQGARYIKRFYVRRFANDINRSMKQVLYGNLVHKSAGERGRRKPFDKGGIRCGCLCGGHPEIYDGDF